MIKLVRLLDFVLIYTLHIHLQIYIEKMYRL